jgi:hypothetical protein
MNNSEDVELMVRGRTAVYVLAILEGAFKREGIELNLPSAKAIKVVITRRTIES